MRLVAVLLAIAVPVCAQFKSTATLVVAPTTFVDAKGNYVEAEPGDLILYDNGRRQPIQVDEQRLWVERAAGPAAREERRARRPARQRVER
jgi:uncharacterized protein YfaT (DUF1175 family)